MEQKEKKVIDSNTAILIDNLYKAYGKKEVLMGLDLEVEYGCLFGFIGRNGIGKSTTIDCMIGAKRFQKGHIYVGGNNITLDPLAAKKVYGYVASEPIVYEAMTGYEYLEFTASIYGLSEKEFEKSYKYLAKRLMLQEDELNSRVSEYSHGMKQKLCLIASLLHSPKIWILDEPTVGLDIIATEELKKMLREYADSGNCVFVTSHNIDLVSKLCDKVAIINNGKVVHIFDLVKNPNRRLQLAKIFVDEFGGVK